MNRPWQTSLNESILEKIRTEIPSAVLRTSLIVGFPGEKKEHFEHLLEFLDRHKFDHVGVFIFSPEEGTAAFDLPNKVSVEVAEARKDNIISVQQNISKVPIPWIRIHYAYPTGLTDEVIRAFKDSKNIVPYFDLPLQHSHPDVLKSMNRPWQASLNESILEKIREEIPSAVLRTSLIVGFPGEKKEHFEHLLEFLDRHKFDHVGVFIFSPEEGTAAFHLPNKVSPEVAEARKDNVISVQQNISKDKNQSYVGSKMKILVEKISENNELIGRSYNFAPEIDGTVILSVEDKIDLKNYIGKFVEANISFADEYDLYGEAIKIL